MILECQLHGQPIHDHFVQEVHRNHEVVLQVREVHRILEHLLSDLRIHCEKSENDLKIHCGMSESDQPRSDRLVAHKSHEVVELVAHMNLEH